MTDKRNAFWALLLVLFAFQSVVFYAQLTTQITPFYPRNHDQLAYLGATYQLVRRAYQEGLWALWSDIHAAGRATAATFTAQGALMALIGGPNRAAVMSLNFVYFLALQAMIFVTVIRKTCRIDLAWLGVGLVITAPSLFNGAGGMLDFRLDFGALCLFGIWTCAVLRTDGWRDAKWSVIAGLCAGLMVSTRFITVTYVISIGSAMLLALIVLSLRTHDFTRCRNLLLSALTFAACVGPFFYWSRDAIYGYYGVGHVLGPEREIRIAEVGIRSLFDHLSFYPVSVVRGHFGVSFLILSAVIVLLALAQPAQRSPKPARSPIFDLAFLALCICGAIAVLTAHGPKSSVVAGIVLIPTVLFVVFVAAAPRRRPLAGLPVAILMVCAIFGFTANANVNQHAMPLEDLRTVNRLNTAAADYIVANKLTRPQIGVDRVVDFLNGGTVWIVMLERDLRAPAVTPVGSLGSIFEISREDALAALAKTDIAFLSDKGGGKEAYPFHRSMGEHWSAMNEYAEKNMQLLTTGKVTGVTFRVYVRPPK